MPAKRVPRALKRVPITITLPAWVVVYLRAHDAPVSRIVERAIVKACRIAPPPP